MLRPEGRFPTVVGNPLPSETIRAIEFIRSSSDDQIMKIWDSQLRASEELVRSCTSAQNRWNSCIPGSISASSGKFQTVAVKTLLRQLNVGGEAWLDQFSFGFPITGKLSQSFLFPRGKKSADRLPLSAIFSSSAARFKVRAAKSGLKNAAPMRAEAMGQVRVGLDP